MQQDFTPIDLRDRGVYRSCWEQCPQHSMDYTLTNLWGWARYYGLMWQFSDGLCWLRQTAPDVECFWAPVGPWEAVDWSVILPREGLRMRRVPERLALYLSERLAGRVELIEERGQWEYLYSADELARLPGNRFHRKKNHANAYAKSYGVDYRELDAAVMEDVFALQDEWCLWHECQGSPSLLAENEAINRVLSHWQELGSLTGGALYADGHMTAFCVGEELGDGVMGVHYEKGHQDYRGVYQAINRCFAAACAPTAKLLNRAQDLDEDGLRQAKMSYLPADFLRKYTVSIAPA